MHQALARLMRTYVIGASRLEHAGAPDFTNCSSATSVNVKVRTAKRCGF
jgi:hypothetical protein